MQKYEDLILEEILEDENEITLVFVDSDKSEVHDIKWRKKRWDKTKKVFVEDENQLKNTERLCEKFLGLPLSDIQDAEGQAHTVYQYDTYESLEESDAKFDVDMVGELIQTKIESIHEEDNFGIIIRYQNPNDDNRVYRTNMKWTEWRGNKYMVKPLLRSKRYRQFEDKFGVPFDEKDKLIGKDIKVLVKEIGGNAFGDILPFPKKK